MITVTFYISMVHLSQLMDHCWHVIINPRLNWFITKLWSYKVLCVYEMLMYVPISSVMKIWSDAQAERGGYMFWKPLLTAHTVWLNSSQWQSRSIVRNVVKENQHESHIAFVVVWDAGIRVIFLLSCVENATG